MTVEALKYKAIGSFETEKYGILPYLHGTFPVTCRMPADRASSSIQPVNCRLHKFTSSTPPSTTVDIVNVPPRVALAPVYHSKIGAIGSAIWGALSPILLLRSASA